MVISKYGMIAVGVFVFCGSSVLGQGPASYRSVPLKARITTVQPMTGIVLWDTNEVIETASIQLEYSYFTYRQIVAERGQYDWSELEKQLDAATARGHQMVIRWHDTYVGMPTGIPAYIVKSEGYKLVRANSEGKRTEFPDWSSPTLQSFLLDFFTQFAEKYDNDPRIAFVQVGFGLWAEYHIYDGPMKLGGTFPDLDYQRTFGQHLAKTLKTTPWMISVDAAGDHTPWVSDPKMLDLRFGLFDDSFNHKQHRRENEPNWIALGMERWKTSPMGGEFAFFDDADQRLALAPKGAHGIPFEEHATRFHLSFIIGDAQPEYQTDERIKQASMALGYRFRVTQFETNGTASRIEIANEGIAPLYYDAYPAIAGQRAKQSLKLLLPGERRKFDVSHGSVESPNLKIECDRLVAGQKIEFEASLE